MVYWYPFGGGDIFQKKDDYDEEDGLFIVTSSHQGHFENNLNYLTKFKKKTGKSHFTSVSGLFLKQP